MICSGFSLWESWWYSGSSGKFVFLVLLLFCCHVTFSFLISFLSNLFLEKDVWFTIDTLSSGQCVFLKGNFLVIYNYQLKILEEFLFSIREQTFGKLGISLFMHERRFLVSWFHTKEVTSEYQQPYGQMILVSFLILFLVLA